MCRSIKILFAVAVLGVNLFGQSIPSPLPNFSGKWQSEDGLGSKYFMQISHTGDQMVIHESFEHLKRTYSLTITLYSDRRGELNHKWIPGLSVPFEVKSETFWKKDKLVRKSSYTLESKDWNREGETIVSEDDEYGLSKDEQTLTIKSISQIKDSSRLRHVILPPGSGLPPRGENTFFSMHPKKRKFRRF